MEVSLIIPAFNEEKRITHTMECVSKFMNKHFKSYEVIVVDDGSTDGTIDVLKTYHDVHLKIISQGRNRGKGQAIKTGMSYAKGDYCFFMDADLPYPLNSMIEAIKVFRKTGADLVIGSRDLYKEKPDVPYPLHRKIMSRMFSLFINGILHLGISDTQCGFKGFTNNAAKGIFPMITIDGFGFDFEMLYIAKKYHLDIQQIPVNLSHTGGSKVNIISDSLKMMRDALKVRINDWKRLYDIEHENVFLK
jgi:dolichyl-phosphate beta-glucosyltransferase